MNWFKHDSNAATDAKIQKLIIKYGAVGYAIYFYCLELIAGKISNANITFELEHDSETIAHSLFIKGDENQSGTELVSEIMYYIVHLGLFENHDGRITCMKMLYRLDSSMTSNPMFRDLIKKAKENHDSIMINHDKSCEIMTNQDSSCKNRIEKNRLEKNKETVGSDDEIERKSTKKTKVPPDINDLSSYVEEYAQSLGVVPRFSAEDFYDYYAGQGWKKKNGRPLLDWKAGVRTWFRNQQSREKTEVKGSEKYTTWESKK